jgi:predicted Zn-dependent peptidase
MPQRQSLALGVWVKAGGRFEDSQEKGISHFLEHLLFKGTQKYSCRRIKESIEGVGGYLNGFTAEELTCYLVKIPGRYLDLALDVLSDMVLNPLLSEQDIEKEKTVILEEIKMYKDQPQSYVYELLDELMWPNQPLGLPIIGTIESVTKIDKANLVGFKERYYTCTNFVISAAGLFDFEKLTRKVDAIFSGRGSSASSAFSKARPVKEKPNLKVFHKDTEQTHLALGFYGFSRNHPLRHALGLLHIILGANMSSRLFNELREKRGLAYEIGTSVKRLHDTGAFLVHAGIDNRKVPEAIKLILEELAKPKDKLVTQGEFRRAKEFYSGQLMLALEDSLEHMLWIGEQTTSEDRVYSLEQFIKQVNKVTLEDLRDVAKQIFKESNLNLSLIGPLRDYEQEIANQLHI